MAMMNEGKDAHYSMRVVTRLTGLSADTIRAWERRYNAVVPHRTKGNTRRYDSDDVKRLTLLKEATDRGYRISDLTVLSNTKLKELITVDNTKDRPQIQPEDDPAFQRIRQNYLNAVLDFDSRGSREILARASVVFSPFDFVVRILLPMLREVGDKWESGEMTVAHEHLASMQVRSLLETILRTSFPRRGSAKIISATPSGHFHEFGALCGALLAALRGMDVLYLGYDVPTDDLKVAAEASEADIVLLSIVLREPPDQTKQAARKLNELASSVNLWVGLDRDHALNESLVGLRTFHDFEKFDIALTELIA